MEVIFTLIPCSCILKRVKCVICFFIVEYFVSYHLLFQIIKYTIIYFLPFILTYLEIKIIFDKFITRLLNFVVLVKYSNFISEAHVQQCDFRVNTNAFRWTDKSQFRSVSTRFFFFKILNIEYLTSWFSATYRNW